LSSSHQWLGWLSISIAAFLKKKYGEGMYGSGHREAGDGRRREDDATTMNKPWGCG
jgi:hypothetical protein